MQVVPVEGLEDGVPFLLGIVLLWQTPPFTKGCLFDDFTNIQEAVNKVAAATAAVSDPIRKRFGFFFLAGKKMCLVIR